MIDFEIATERASAVVENKSIFTTLNNYNCLQKSPSSLFKLGVLNAKSSKLILGDVNINSIRNKFEVLKFIIDHNIDIFLIAETKLDKSFFTAQLLIKSFSTPYRFDRNSKGGERLLYIREDTPPKILKHS